MMAGLYSSYAPEPDSIGTNFSRGTYTCCFGNFGSCAFSCGCSPLRHPGAFSRVRRRRVGPLGQLPRLRPRYRAGHVGRLGLAPRSSPPYRAGHVGPLGPFLRLRPRLHLGYVARARIRPRRAVPLFRTCGFCRFLRRSVAQLCSRECVVDASVRLACPRACESGFVYGTSVRYAPFCTCDLGSSRLPMRAPCPCSCP